MSSVQPYVGRFAPSPTGPLHFGSLVAALASYLDARSNGGKWLLRIEDLDPPRESPTAPAEIIEQLKAFGLEWDESPLFQSTRLDAYQESLNGLESAQKTYRCRCSRKKTRGVYPGTCRDKSISDDQPSAVRLRVPDTTIEFDDQILGLQRYRARYDIGDFIIKRKDGLFAYQLAVTVDDEFQGVNHVIRGSDLLDSTPRQICIAQYLGFRVMHYAHFPVILGNDGQKLSKQTHASPIATEDARSVIIRALGALGQKPVKRATIDRMLHSAVNQWSLETVPKRLNLEYQHLG